LGCINCFNIFDCFYYYGPWGSVYVETLDWVGINFRGIYLLERDKIKKTGGKDEKDSISIGYDAVVE